MKRITVKVSRTLRATGPGSVRCGMCGATVRGNSRHTCSKTFR